MPAETAATIVDWIAGGHPLTEFCRRPNSPGLRTVYDWLAKDESFEAAFERAREIGCDALADGILAIAEESPPDGQLPDAAFVARQRLRIDARRWLLARWHPRRYGDRVLHAQDGQVKIVVEAVPLGPPTARQDGGNGYAIETTCIALPAPVPDRLEQPDDRVDDGKNA